MASNNQKIRAQDIFDESVKVAYKDFVELNKEAAQTVKDLKTAIIQLNSAIKKNKPKAGPMKKVSAATKDLATNSDKAKEEVRQLGNEAKKTEKKLNSMGKGGKRATGSLSKLFGGVRQLAGAAGFAGLFYSIIQVTRSVYTQIKALQSMELALAKVTDSSYEFSEAQSYLVEMTDRLGINLLKTAKRYTTFRAAAKQAQLTQNETNEIFETFADVGANLALTSDEMGGIFLALEQMLSKGKISTEELRRQLGERLPGAFGIMAEAVGVTTAELDDMLRKGELLTKDYLPKFAKQVEKTFGTDKTKRVDTMAAAQERLTNAWTLFVQVIGDEDGVISKGFKAILSGLTSMLDLMTQIIEQSNKPGFLRAMASYLPGGYGASGAFGASSAQDDIEKQAAAQKEAFKEFQRVYKEFSVLNNSQRDGAFTSLMFGASKETLDIYIEQFKKGILEIQEAEKKGRQRQAAGRQTALESGTAGIMDVLLANEKQLMDQVRKFRDWASEAISVGKEGEARFWAGMADEAQKGLDSYREKGGQLFATSGGSFDPSGAGLTAYQKSKEQARENSTTTGNEGTLFGGLDDKEAWIQRLDLAKDLANEMWQIEENLHQRRLQRLEEEREASAKKYEELYRLAEGDSDQTERLRIREAEEQEKLDEKEKQLERDQAKRKKRQALIDIALNTAVALIAAWKTPLLAIPMTVAIGAAALAQTAAVLSLPEYAEGTDFHEGGPAIVGDGGKRELIINPDGSMEVTSDKPQIVDMERGSKVVADAQDFINKQVIKSILDTNEKMDEMIVEKITEAVQKGFKGVNINNNVTLKGSADFHAYRHKLLN